VDMKTGRNLRADDLFDSETKTAGGGSPSCTLEDIEWVRGWSRTFRPDRPGVLGEIEAMGVAVRGD
jgi:hypothetical protein